MAKWEQNASQLNYLFRSFYERFEGEERDTAAVRDTAFQNFKQKTGKRDPQTHTLNHSLILRERELGGGWERESLS